MADLQHPAIDYECCVAFYDDALPAVQMASVARWLRANPQIAARARRDATRQHALRQHFEHVLYDPVPERLQPARRKSDSRWPGRVGAGAAVMVAAFCGWWLGAHSMPGVGAQRFASRIGMPSRDQNVQRVVDAEADTSAASLMRPDLSARGYSFVARTVLHGKPQPLTEFLYRNKVGAQIRIYARPQPERLTRTPRLSSHGGVSLVQWREHGIDYALAGPVPKSSLEALAKTAAGSGLDPHSQSTTRLEPVNRATPLAAGRDTTAPVVGESAAVDSPAHGEGVGSTSGL